MPITSYPGRNGTGTRAAMRLTFTRAERETIARAEDRTPEASPPRLRVLRAEDLNHEETEPHVSADRS